METPGDADLRYRAYCAFRRNSQVAYITSASDLHKQARESACSVGEASVAFGVSALCHSALNSGSQGTVASFALVPVSVSHRMHAHGIGAHAGSWRVPLRALCHARSSALFSFPDRCRFLLPRRSVKHGMRCRICSGAVRPVVCLFACRMIARSVSGQSTQFQFLVHGSPAAYWRLSLRYLRPRQHRAS